MTFRRGTLEDTDHLYTLVPDPVTRVHCIRRLKLPIVYVFFNEDSSGMIIYEPSFGNIPWMNSHVFTTDQCRGSKLKEFTWEVGLWLFENTNTEVITCLAPANLRSSGLFLANMGAVRQYEHNGIVMYTYDRTMVPEFREKLEALRAKE